LSRRSSHWPVPLCLAGAQALACGSEKAEESLEPVAIAFEARVNGAPFACGTPFEDVGDPAVSFAMTDARLYIHALELLDASGQAARLELDESAFQNDGLTLLDFEDGCGEDGSTETHTTITARGAPGEYRSLRFTLGVPLERNFVDLASAAPPLDVTAMFWIWQYGYKYLKLDGTSPAEEGGLNPFFVHLGASECPGDNPEAAPTGRCRSPNQATIELEDFTPGESTVVVDVGALLATSDLSVNTEGTAPGCMSETNDPECALLLPRLGVGSGEEPQALFAVE
jgi:uncharacterized repeat protein (TIGR04052 family)